MRPTLNEYFDTANQCGRVLFRAFAANLDLDLDHYTQQFDRPITRGALVFYPPQPPDLCDDQFGVAAHTDYGCLTLVYLDPIGGLQVKGRNGAPPLYRPVTCGDYSVSRFDASFAYRNKGSDSQGPCSACA